MPAKSMVQPPSITSVVDAAAEQFLRDFPQYKAQFTQLLDTRFSTEAESTQPKESSISSLSSTLPPEEVFSIFEKLKNISQLPGLTLDNETQLYLEQQLEDLLGFAISTESGTLKLNFVKGLVESLPHSYSLPNLDIQTIKKVKEAGINTKRSVFGWQMHSLSNTATKESNPYWVSLSLRSLISERQSFSNTKKAAFQKKVVMINPTEGVCAIGEILDDYSDFSHRYQMGASPAIIREGLFWSPQNLGKVIVFFVSDTSTALSPGVYSLLS